MDVITLAKINELKKSGSVGYEETEWVEALAETTVEVAMNEDAGVAVGVLPFIQAEKGCKAKVVFDGVTYDTEYRGVEMGNEATFGIGNFAFAGLEDTGEPFLLIPQAVGGGEDYSMILCEEGMHTISVSVERTLVHNVDPKFLPFVIPCVTLETVVDVGSPKTLSENDSKTMDSVLGFESPCAITYRQTGGGHPISSIFRRGASYGRDIYIELVNDDNQPVIVSKLSGSWHVSFGA